MPDIENDKDQAAASAEAAPQQAPGQQGADAVQAAGEAPHPEPEEQIDFILDIPLEIRVELGRTRMQINELLKLGQGSVIELGKSAGENLEILANNRLIAKGEVVVSKEKYAIRLTEIISPMERVETLR